MNNIIEIFLKNVEKNPSKIAVILKDKTYTYKQLQLDIEEYSYFFESSGLTKNTHTLLILENSYEFIVSMLAIANIGAVIAPLSTTLKKDAILKAISTTQSTYLITNSKIKNKLNIDAVSTLCIDTIKPNHESYKLNMNKIDISQDYILTLTSGSTGDPKPIVFTQETKINRSLLAARDLYNLDSSERIIVASPLYHSMGQRLILLPLLIGATCVLLPKFSPKLWIETVQKHKITFTIAIASHLNILVQTLKPQDDMSSLHTIVSSSSLLEDDIKAQCIEKFGCDFHECYGASEVGIVTNLAPIDCKSNLSSVGKALPFVDIKIVNDKKEVLGVNKIGEIIVRSKTAFSRYFNNKEITKQNVIDGYFYTADLGMIDERGFLYLKGRKKDVIIVGGTNVYPLDIENEILKVPHIKECCVIPIKDQYFGEVIMAVIVPSDEQFDLKEVKKACIRNLAEYQQPMCYEITKDLPKNDLGKIMKYKLIEQYKDYDVTKYLRGILT